MECNGHHPPSPSSLPCTGQFNATVTALGTNGNVHLDVMAAAEKMGIDVSPVMGNPGWLGG